MRWYHGGVAGLQPGGWLLPRLVTGQFGSTEHLASIGIKIEGMEPDRDRADRVYLTHDRRLGRAYAAHAAICGGQRYGALYVAEPVDPEPDPDLPEWAIQCPRAKILSIYDPCVIMPAERCARILFSVVTAPARFTRAGIQFR